MKCYILPVICGMLISTSCSMVAESMKIAGEVGIGGLKALTGIVVAVELLWYLQKRFQLHDMLLLLGAAANSLFIFCFV